MIELGAIYELKEERWCIKLGLNISTKVRTKLDGVRYDVMGAIKEYDG